MSVSIQDLKDAYGDDWDTKPREYQLGPYMPGSEAFDRMPTQLIDGPEHVAKIEVHGDDCKAVAEAIVVALNAVTPPEAKA